MKAAVMQPYLFPYIGYYQLIKVVDKFIFYDDVNFIKQGWINRNRILVDGKDFMFTVPLDKAGSFTLIKDTLINVKLYDSWRAKFLKTIKLTYKNAPYFSVVSDLIEEVLNKKHKKISELAIESVIATSIHLGLETKFLISSKSYSNVELNREDRLIDICKRENVEHYINAIGGQSLYDKDSFAQKGVKLEFIKPLPINYVQFNNEFIPWLSIIDVLMFNSTEDINNMLDKFELK